MKEEAAILLAREGHEDAFRVLYDNHRERIYRIGEIEAREPDEASLLLGPPGAAAS